MRFKKVDERNNDFINSSSLLISTFDIILFNFIIFSCEFLWIFFDLKKFTQFFIFFK